MVTETVNYVGLGGVDVTKKLYFNLTRADLSELDMDIEGGFEGLQKRVNTDFQGTFAEYYKIIKKVIAKSYGVKSSDGKTLIKPEEETLKFMASEAYSAFIDKLFSDETGDTMIAFLQKVTEEAKKNSPNKAPQVTEEPAIDEVLMGDGKIVSVK